MVNKWRKRLLAFTLILMMMPTAMALETSVFFVRDTKVYQTPSTSSKSLPVNMGWETTMTDITGDWVRVESYGNVAYCKLRDIILKNPMTGYVNTETKLYKSASCSSYQCSLEVGDKLYVYGVDGDAFMVKNSDKSLSGYIPAKYVSQKKVSAPENSKPESSGSGNTEAEEKEESNDWRSKVVMVDWFEESGRYVLRRGSYGYVYDIASGITIRVKRMGGANHADIEPATAEDTAKLLKIVGGKFSWESRAVILIVGDKYVAAAMNTEPHGDQTIYDNNYEGQCCLHLTNSHNHNKDAVNEEHQKSILKAYNWAHS